MNDWRADALCQEYPSAWWFPERGDKMTGAAKAVCERCLVRAECLAFAMSDPDCRRNGIWAGTTPQERTKLRRAAKAA